MESAAAVAVLSAFPLFRGLNATQVENFVAACRELEYDAGSEIITRGRHGEAMFVLLEGRLRIFLPARHGAGARELAQLEAPAVVGEMELLTTQPRAATVQALTHTRLLSIGFDALRSRMDDGDPAALKLVANLARVLATRLNAVNQKLVDIEEGRCEARSGELRAFQTKLFSDWSF
jgi:CRP-like cAMP-binding protein